MKESINPIVRSQFFDSVDNIFFVYTEGVRRGGKELHRHCVAIDFFDEVIYDGSENGDDSVLVTLEYDLGCGCIGALGQLHDRAAFRAFADDVVHWRDLGLAAATGCVLIDGDDDIDFTLDGGKSGTAVLVITVLFLHSAQVLHLGECGVGSSGERLVEVVLPHADAIHCVRLSLLEAANLIFPQCQLAAALRIADRAVLECEFFVGFGYNVLRGRNCHHLADNSDLLTNGQSWQVSELDSLGHDFTVLCPHVELSWRMGQLGMVASQYFHFLVVPRFDPTTCKPQGRPLLLRFHKGISHMVVKGDQPG